MHISYHILFSIWFTCRPREEYYSWPWQCVAFQNLQWGRKAKPFERAISLIHNCMRLHWSVIAPFHNDVIKWKHFPRYWPFVWEIHRWLVNSPHKGQLRGALMFLWYVSWINSWVNTREAGDLRRHRGHYDVIVMRSIPTSCQMPSSILFILSTYSYAWCLVIWRTGHRTFSFRLDLYAHWSVTE